MAFRGIREAVEAYKKFKAKVLGVEEVYDEQDNIRYYAVTVENKGVVNCAPKGVDLLKQRYDFDDISDIIGQELDFWYTKNKDKTFGEYQLSFVFDVDVKQNSTTTSAKQNRRIISR